MDSDDETIAVHVEARPAGKDVFRVDNLHDGSRHELSPQDLFILNHATRFRTKEAQLHHLLEAGWPCEQQASLAPALEKLLGLGLLRRKPDFLARAKSLPGTPGTRGTPGPAPEEPPPISVCAWVTRDRPATLSRNVLGLIGHNRAHGREPEYHVYDDTPDRRVREQIRARLREIVRETGARVHHVGLEEKKAFLEAMLGGGEARGLSGETIRFALEYSQADVFGAGIFRTGANQNALLLGTSGRMALSSDDDVECLPAQLPGRREGLELFSFHSPNRLVPLENAEAAHAQVRLADIPLLKGHERLLGRDVSTLLREGELAPVETGRMTPSFCRRLESAGGRVLVTSAGSYGDSGMGNQKLLLILEGEGRERIVASEAAYRRASASHQVVNIAETHAVSEGISLLFMNVGLDNRDLLPPCLPFFRGQDTLFAATLRRSFSAGLIGHLPFGLFHNPPQVRASPPEGISDPGINVGGFMIMLVETCKPPPAATPPEEGLRGLGGHLEALGGLPLKDFKALARERWKGHVQAMSGQLEELLERYGSHPSWWAADCRAYLGNLRDSTAQDDGALPRDLGAGPPGWKHAADLASRFGRLCVAWPEMVLLARDLEREGRGLAGTPLGE